MADKLLMDDTELSISFRKAKDPRGQVTVLADLNACAPFAVAQRLEAMGLFDGTDLCADQFAREAEPAKPRRKYPAQRRPPATEPIDELRAMELFRDGLDDTAIAEALDVSESRIKKWRQRMHLLRPRGGNRKQKETEAMETTEQAAQVYAVPEPQEEQAKELLTVAEFLATLTELLTPAATRAGLIINGSPVALVTGLHIRTGAGKPVLEITTEGNT